MQVSCSSARCGAAGVRMPATPSVARAAQRYCGCSSESDRRLLCRQLSLNLNFIATPRPVGAVLRGRRHGVAPAKSPAAFPPAGSHGISPDATSMTTSTSPGPPGPLHYAVVGAGLAGVAAAWQLLVRVRLKRWQEADALEGV